MKTVVKKIVVVGLCLMILAVGRYLFVPPVLPQYTVGLVYVPSRAFHEQLNTKLKQLIALDKRFKVVEFTAASADQMLLTAVCDRALEEPIDVFVTTGQYCSQTLVKLAAKRNLSTPIIFSGVVDPAGLGLVDSIERPGANATGIFTQVMLQEINPCDVLLLAKPATKKILLVYAVDVHNNEQSALFVKQFCIQKNISVTLLPIDNISETLSRVSSVIKGHDVVMYLDVDLVNTYGVGMGKIASQHNVTFFAPDPNGMAAAALAYTILPAKYADRVFNFIRRMVIDKAVPATTPAELVDSGRYLIINKKLCREQDLLTIDVGRIAHEIETNPAFALIRNQLVVL